MLSIYYIAYSSTSAVLQECWAWQVFNRLELVLNMLNTWAQAAVKQVFNRCSTEAQGKSRVFPIDVAVV